MKISSITKESNIGSTTVKKGVFYRGLLRRLANDNRGFTILETMVATMILSLVITAMVVATAGGFSNINTLKNSLTASYLSQEGIELVRKVRDDAVIQIDDSALRWDEFLSGIDDCETINGCTIWYNPNTANVEIDTYTTSDYLKYDEDRGYYGYDVGDDTFYRRRVFIDVLNPATREVEVVSVVTWKQGETEKSFETREIMFNWF